jgi:hypothetical protein
MAPIGRGAPPAGRFAVYWRLLLAAAHTPWRGRGFADRLGPEFGEYAPQGADAWRELVAVVLDNGVTLIEHGDGFFV